MLQQKPNTYLHNSRRPASVARRAKAVAESAREAGAEAGGLELADPATRRPAEAAVAVFGSGEPRSDVEKLDLVSATPSRGLNRWAPLPPPHRDDVTRAVVSSRSASASPFASRSRQAAASTPTPLVTNSNLAIPLFSTLPEVSRTPQTPPPCQTARRAAPSRDGVRRRARRGDAEAVQVQRAGPLGGGQVRASALLEPLRHPLPALDATKYDHTHRIYVSSSIGTAWLYIFTPPRRSSPQTFDAVDGKQARRTSSSSPLGELFDHGCDALACAFEALALGSTLMCGRLTFCYWVVAVVPFYLATWEHFFTNTLILPVINGPTEGLMLIYVSHFFTFLTGAEWWAQDFQKSLPLFSWVPLPFVPETPLYVIVMILMILFAVIPTIGSNVSNVQKVVDSRKGSMVLALAMLLPFIALLAGVAVWCYLSPSDIMRNQPHLLVIGTGFAFGYLVGRMILAHLCDEPKGLKTGMCMSLVFLPFAIANALTAKINDGTPIADELLVLSLYCSYTVSLYLHLAVSVVHEIKDALGIYCFRITRKEA